MIQFVICPLALSFRQQSRQGIVNEKNPETGSVGYQNLFFEF